MEPRSQRCVDAWTTPLPSSPFAFVCPVFCMKSSVRKYTRAKKMHSNRHGGLERCCLLARKDTRLLSTLPEESGPYHTLFGTSKATRFFGTCCLFALEHETRTRPRCHIPNKAFVRVEYHCLDGVLCHSFLAPAVQLPRLPFEYPPHSRPLPALHAPHSHSNSNTQANHAVQSQHLRPPHPPYAGRLPHCLLYFGLYWRHYL